MEEFGPDDAEEIAAIFRRVWPNARGYPAKWRERRQLGPAAIRLEMAHGYHYFGLRRDGAIVGLYKAIVTPKGLKGEHQSVLSSALNTGLAQAMYRQFYQYALERDCQKNYCYIKSDQRSSLKIMEKFGFEAVGPVFEQAPGLSVQLFERPIPLGAAARARSFFPSAAEVARRQEEWRFGDAELNLWRLRLQLLCRGARVDDPMTFRRTGAGPAGGKYFHLPDGRTVNIPLDAPFVTTSPFRLTPTPRRSAQRRPRTREPERYYLYYHDDELCELTAVVAPRYMTQSPSLGRYALIHGDDCVATTLDQRCIYWRSGDSCRFCGIELSLAEDTTVHRKRPEELMQVIRAAADEGRAGHLLITSGTQPGEGRGAALMAKTVKRLKKMLAAELDLDAGLPVQVQLEPVPRQWLEQLHASGVDCVGIHIETFDEEVRRALCPGKAKTPQSAYWSAWREAVAVFGRGQISTYLLIGLGEDEDETVHACERASALGVIPFCVPFRPIRGTAMERAEPPNTDYYERILRSVQQALSAAGLSLAAHRAGCPRCGACSGLVEHASDAG